MYAQIASLLVLAAAALSAHAQIDTDACIISCLAAAASAAGCSSNADLPCVCTSADFQNTAAECISATCPPGDLAATKELQSLECGTAIAKVISSLGL